MQINKREFLKTMGLLPIAPAAFIGSLDRLDPVEQSMPKNIIALKAMAKHILTVPDKYWGVLGASPLYDFNSTISYYYIGHAHDDKIIGGVLAHTLSETVKFIGHKITSDPWNFDYILFKMSPSIIEPSMMRNLFILQLANCFGIDYWAAEKMFLSDLNRIETSEFILDHVADVENQIKTFRKNGLTTRTIYLGTNQEIEYPIT